MDSEANASAVEVARRVRTGECSAVEVARAALKAAEETEPLLSAFASLTPERALAQAAAIDAARGRGEELGPLAGVPCPIKDLTEVEGLPFEAGSRALAGNVGVRTDPVVERLVAAGALVIGKTATPEFGFPCYTEPAGRHPTVTPWDLRRGAGGSSGGAASAVAAGVVPIAHASDGGGSIRIPASSCGIVGLKPSRGLVSALPVRAPGVGLACDGVVSRTVTDTALGLDVLAGGGTGLAAAVGRDPGRLRIGLTTVPVISDVADVHPACADAAVTVARLLMDLGHEVVEAPRAFPAERWAAFDAVWTTGAASLPLPHGAESALTPMTAWLRARGRKVSGADYARAIAAIQLLEYEVEQKWAGLDAVLTPTLASPPAFAGQLRYDSDPAADFAAQIDYTPWTSIANLTGRPSISLPLVRTAIDGMELPIGVMLTGVLGRDDVLLALAAQLEVVAPWPLVRSIA